MNDLWVIIPFLDCWDATYKAALDVLAQEGVNTRVLLIDNGGGAETRKMVDDVVGAGLGDGLSGQGRRLLVWHHKPELPSLAATWNQALDFVWAAGGERAWVMNNDVRVQPHTALWLLELQKATSALFVSAVGVTEEQYRAYGNLQGAPGAGAVRDLQREKGGPDFSCFIITKECHQKYRFDEAFIPCYCEDLDYHRRLMLGGDGKRIFSVNVPYLHVDNGSGTLKAMDEASRRRKEDQINRGSRAYYERKWGGAVNQERFRAPFDQGEPEAFPVGYAVPRTTPELQRETWR